MLDGDARLRKVQAELAVAEQAHDGTALARLHSELEVADGYTADARARKLLAGLGFTNEQMDRRVGDFSGGWRMRLNLAQALMCPSDLLLLDEPTNHLDLDAILWLEDWLKGYPGTLLLISHDRDFLDAVVDHVLHVEQRKLNLYKGGYTAFERTRAERLAQQQQAYEKQQAQRAHMEKYIARFKAQATKARQAQSRIKALERMEELSAAHVDSPFDFVFRESQKISSPLLSLSEGRLGYGDKAILDKVKLQLVPGARIGLLGPNGAGKSTLIKNLAGELEPLSGRLVRGENLAVGYFAQHQLDSLDDKASPLLHLQRIAPTEREQTLRDFLGGFDFHGDRVDEPVVNFSGGEKARLALALIAWERPNLLLLDEPTNHLDLEMRLALTMALQEFAGAVVVVSTTVTCSRAPPTISCWWQMARSRPSMATSTTTAAGWSSTASAVRRPATPRSTRTRPTRRPSARRRQPCASSWHRTRRRPTSWRPSSTRCMRNWPRSRLRWVTVGFTRRRARMSCAIC